MTSEDESDSSGEEFPETRIVKRKKINISEYESERENEPTDNLHSVFLPSSDSGHQTVDHSKETIDQESDVKFWQVQKFQSNIVVDDIIEISDTSEDETDAEHKQINKEEDIKFWKVAKFHPPIAIHDVIEISDDDDYIYFISNTHFYTFILKIIY